LLGLIKSGRKWNWAAFGKHPSVKDYFQLGKDLLIFRSFSNWMEKGYKTLCSNDMADREPVAWRFWAKGTEKDHIVCGVLRDSSDSLGRPYPLLIIGNGYLKDWGKYWDLLPFAFEKPWSRVEYLSTQMFNGLKTLETEVEKIRYPYPEWSEFISKRKEIMEPEPTSQSGASLYAFGAVERGKASDLSNKAGGFIYLNKSNRYDQFALISRWHIFLKTHNKEAPNAVFMGGTFEKDYMAFFKRPLHADDFIQLWS
jgi:type VI secretion system protein VasJ